MWSCYQFRSPVVGDPATLAGIRANWVCAPWVPSRERLGQTTFNAGFGPSRIGRQTSRIHAVAAIDEWQEETGMVSPRKAHSDASRNGAGTDEGYGETHPV